MKYMKKKEGVNMNTTLERPCTPKESLKKALKEMNLIREGKLPKKTWRDLFKELEEEKGE